MQDEGREQMLRGVGQRKKAESSFGKGVKGRPMKVCTEQLAGRKNYFNPYYLELAKFSLILGKQLFGDDAHSGFFHGDQKRMWNSVDEVVLGSQYSQLYLHRAVCIRRILFALNNVFSKSYMAELAPFVEQLFYALLLESVSEKNMFMRFVELKFIKEKYRSQLQRAVRIFLTELVCYIKSEIMEFIELCRRIFERTPEFRESALLAMH